MKNTPTSVMVLGIIGIVLGVFGVCGMGLAVVGMFVSIAPRGTGAVNIYNDPGYRLFLWIVIPIGISLVILQLAASIGSIQLQRWARKGMIVYAWGALVQTVVGGIVNVTYVVPKMVAAMPAATAGPAHMSATIAAFGGYCGSFLGLIYPGFVLYFFTRTHVINAFDGIFPAGSGDFAVLYPSDQIPPPAV